MANQFGTIASQVGLLKNFYEGPIVTQFNDEVKIYGAAEKGKEKWSGLQVIRPLKVRRNPGIGATSDGGPLPSVGVQTTIQAQIAARYHYLRFGLTAPLLKAAQNDKGAFASNMQFEMDQGLIDFKNDMNRALFWNGEGRLAVVSAAAVASLTITATGRTSGENGDKYLFPTMVVDIVNPTTGVYSAQGVTINALSGTTTATLTLSQAVTVSANDIIVHANSYNVEVQGIRTVLDGASTTIYGVNRSTYPIYNGTVVDAAGAQLSLDLMQRTLNEVRRKGGSKLKAIFCDFDSERYYNKLLVADKRFVEKSKGDGTFTYADQSYLEFGGIAVVPDKDSPGNEMVFMSNEGWKKYVLGSELEWADETGSLMIAQAGVDAWEVRLRNFANMFPEKPVGMARLTGFISP